MNLNKIDLGSGSTLNIAKTSKFKNIAIVVCFKGIMKKEGASSLALLDKILPLASNKYPSITSMASTLDSYYGALQNTMVDSYGNISLFYFNSLFINGKYLSKPISLIEEQFKLLSEVIYHPFSKDNKFDETYFNQRKDYYLQFLKSQKNRKETQAVRGIKSLMDDKHPLSISLSGYLEEAINLKNEDVYQTYLEVISRPFDVYVLGEVADSEVLTLVNKYLKVNPNPNNYDFKPIIPYPLESFVKKEEALPFSQSQLIQAYHLDINYEDNTSRYVGMVFNAIFGAGGSSRLYNNIREKYGFAYSINSQLIYTVGVMYVTSGLSLANVEKCVELIEEELKVMQEGKFTSKELKMAKNIFANIVKAQFDDIYSSIAFYAKDNILNKVISQQEYIEGIKNVTKEDVVNFAKKITLIKQFLVKENKGGNNHE